MKLVQNPKKSLGQNFLIDKNIINKITKILDSEKNPRIMEIGSGYGNLTNSLAKINSVKIIAIEKDKKLSQFLKKKFKNNLKIKIINQDILEVIKKDFFYENVIVIGNLPYNISTKILTSLIMVNKWPPWYNSLIFMFQKEVADRIIAKPYSKEFGRLSILTNWRLEIKKHFNISKNCFYPKPKIDSTILSFRPKKNIPFKIKNPKNLELVTRVLFSNRRKMINKNFRKLFKNDLSCLNKINIDLNKRPEELDNETFYKIAIEYEKLFD